MARVYKLDILESSDDLKELLRKERVVWKKERIQLLYVLKIQKARTITDAAEIVGRHRVTVQDWLKEYREKGLTGLLTPKLMTGRPRTIPRWAEEALAKRLQEEKGFDSYGEIVRWLEENLGIRVPYKTVHKLVHYRLKASPKIARPSSVERSEEKAEEFKKKCQKT
jgi:transposase